MRVFLLLLILALLRPVSSVAAVWLGEDEILELPTEGPAWTALARRAQQPVHSPSLADQDDPDNVTTLALALYSVRTGDAAAADSVRRIISRVPGTERGARTLAIGRELAAYVIAADLVGLDGETDEQFKAWLRQVSEKTFQGRTLRSTNEDRPNNWGTHAGASRLAIAIYLNDSAEIERTADVFRGWLGERDAWQGFKYGERWWQPPGSIAYGINPAGASLQGRSVDGVVPDDQRRGGPFSWPPPKENYVYEGLQGAVAQALFLEGQGYDVWAWGDRALLRAFQWLHGEADFPAEGDDTWQPHVINHVYGTDFPATSPSTPGKGLGFTDWTHGGSARLLPRPPAVGH